MDASFKLFLLTTFAGMFVSGCNRPPEDPDAARFYALHYSEKVFSKGLKPDYDVRAFMPVAENGCVAYGNNRHFMVILRGTAMKSSGEMTRFRASLDVDMTGSHYEISPIIINFDNVNSDE